MNASRNELSRLSELCSDQQALRSPPQAIDAEQSVLGGLMLRPQAWADVQDLLQAGDFYLSLIHI